MRKEPVDFSGLAEKLRPIIARSHIEKFLGGAISTKRLANMDCRGEGPKRMRIGRKVSYFKEDLLDWLAGRTKVLA